MIEFKQIIGRGTRLYEGKDYFTIWDFVKAYEHFNDPEWDGEPAEPVEVTPRGPTGPREPEPEPGGTEEPERVQRVKIKLADGKERTIQHISITTFWGPDGRPISAKQFMESLFGQLPELFKDEDELRAIWGRPDARRALLNALGERGFGGDQLAEMGKVINAEKSDVFDILAYIAFAVPPITRAERVEQHRGEILPRYDEKLQAFIDFVLGQYVAQGVAELDQDKLKDLLELRYRTLHDAMAELGAAPAIRSAFVGFQERLFAAQDSSPL
jgi:type I restriction enzyme R subunit